MSGRAAVAITIVVAALRATTPASAAPKKKVRIESEPAGASVYLNALEDGEICKTPCAIEVDPDTTVIVDLAGYKPIVEQIVIGRREKAPYKRSYALVASLGKLVIEGPAGATVTIDDVDKGTAPLELELATGTYAVVVTHDGKQVYAQPVEVAANDTVTIEGTEGDGETEPATRGEKPAKRDGTTNGGAIQKTAPAHGEAILIASVDLAIGFRDFAYDNANLQVNPDLNPENEKGQLLAGPAVEFWPGRLLGVELLSGLSVVARYQFGLNAQDVKTDTDLDTGVKTKWSSYELSARQRWLVGALGIEAGVGYVRDQHQFDGAEADLLKVPDADYASMRIGARATYRTGAYEPYLAGETRVVLSGGPLEDRFEMQGPNISGLRGALGVLGRFGAVTGRVEAALTRYTWSFDNKLDAGTDGATDSIKLVSVIVGYAY